MRPEKNATQRIKVSYVRWYTQGPLGSVNVPLGQSQTVYHFPTVIRTSLDVTPAVQCPTNPPSASSGDCGSDGITREVCARAGCCFYDPPQMVQRFLPFLCSLPLNKNVCPLLLFLGLQGNHSGCYFNADVASQAIKDYLFVWQNRENLLSTHVDAWAKLLQNGIKLDGWLHLDISLLHLQALLTFRCVVPLNENSQHPTTRNWLR